MKQPANLILIAALTVVATTFAGAQTKLQPKAQPAPLQVPQKWDREPEAVFGIKLGGLVSELSLPLCPPKNRAGFYDTEPANLCIFNSPYLPEKGADLYGTPELTVPYRASLGYYKGVVSAIYLRLHQSNFEKLKAILMERYGPPTKVEVLEVTSGAGAKLTSQQIEWKGVKTNIMAIERVDTITQSYVAFSDVGTLEKKVFDLNSSTKGDAAKF